MSNYLNQIESDLYKLYSITNGSGEVVEMVAEIKEKYEKAKAFDRVVEERNEAGTDMYGKDDDVVDRVIERSFWNIDGIIVEHEGGEPYAKK